MVGRHWFHISTVTIRDVVPAGGAKREIQELPPSANRLPSPPIEECEPSNRYGASSGVFGANRAISVPLALTDTDSTEAPHPSSANESPNRTNTASLPSLAETSRS